MDWIYIQAALQKAANQIFLQEVSTNTEDV